MRKRMQRGRGLMALTALMLTSIGHAATNLQPGWPDVTQTAHPWIRWWWPGSGVDETNLTHELQAFADAGLGGVEITPIYGAKGYEDRYVDYLSPRWMELLEHTGHEADRLGLGVDMATGTGWPFGGPWVQPEDAAQTLALQNSELALQPTGQQVKRAAPGGEGLVLDPFSPKALDHYLARFDTAFEGFPEGLLRAQFHDSFEYYGANVTDALPEVFAEMHGYRIEPYAAALLDEEPDLDADQLARIKHDYRETLDRLHQGYLRAWTRWAHTHGWKTRNQSHGAPANLLDLYAIADIPETESFGSTPFPIPGLRREPDAISVGAEPPEPLVSRFAASAAHVMGKPLVSCETATWLRDHWKVTLADVKPELDRLFLDGINHVFYHGAAYSPQDAAWPGWFFYAATQFNPRNPWWEDFGALNAYVTRVQSVLQAGRPDSDLLIYWPLDDLWQSPEGLQRQLTVHDPAFVTETAFGDTVRGLYNAGYTFDYISAAQIEEASAQGDRIATPGGDYAALVVPPTQHMTPALLEQLRDLAQNGATVVMAAWPEDVPGLGRLEARRAALQSLRQQLDFQPDRRTGLPIAPIGKGRIILAPATKAVPLLKGVRPEPMIQQGLECIRRRNGTGHDYFIANLGAEAREGWFTLGVEATGATLLDPLTGTGGVAALRQHEGQTQAYLQLAPGESQILRTTADQPAEGEPWAYLAPAGEPHAIEGPWQVHFVRGGPERPEAYQIDALTSWTESSPAAKRFAGTARYETTFEVDPNTADAWILDLGDVRESARVWLNGHLVGTAWSLPYRLRVGAWLVDGPNQLVLEVTNTAANRIRDLDRRGVDWKIMREINLVNIRYRPFDASTWSLQPAGLLGPIRLLPMQAEAEQ